jgi:predicted glycogen debranching enzyme
MEGLMHRMPWRCTQPTELTTLLSREWLVTNGLGGYAAGTLAGVPTRRYHGLLIAALPTPLGRTLLMPYLSEQLRLPDGTIAQLSGVEHNARPLQEVGTFYLTEFCLEGGLPVWRYTVADVVLEKRLLMPHGQNTVLISYRLLQGEDALRLRLLPYVHVRPHDAAVDTPFAKTGCRLLAMDGRYELLGTANQASLRLMLHGPHAALTLENTMLSDVYYRVEARRGYACAGDLWSPGYFRVDLLPGAEATLVASTEPWETLQARPPNQAWAAEYKRRRRLLHAAPACAQTDMAADLVLAADQFIITPSARAGDETRLHAAGDEVRTLIAGYHWFTDWGRDTMISLEGLTLMTGRHVEAGYILRTFADYIRDGLIPNLFPEGEKAGLYHTADATLWFFHALDRYLDLSQDRAMLKRLQPKLLAIVEQHLHGTRFGIGVDPQDGLLRQGQAGYQLTWMDAKVDDWVVTPRSGKAVEINALWYNALRLLEGWMRAAGEARETRRLAQCAAQAQKSFNQRFWYAAEGYLYDVVDGEQGDDPACRPNQILALSLRHPILHRARWQPVLEVVRQRLLTPVGLRSLAPAHADYKPRYDGDLRARDAAYHQGTVWAWLIGPFIDAWLKVYPDDSAGARQFLQGFEAHLSQACMGSISEIFDAEAPFTPRGCVAQAWSVAEVLRCWVKTAT